MSQYLYRVHTRPGAGMKAYGKNALAIRLYWEPWKDGSDSGLWFVDMVIARTEKGMEVVAQYSGSKEMWRKRIAGDNAFAHGFAAAMIREALEVDNIKAPDEMICRAAKNRFGGRIDGEKANAPGR